MYVLMNKIDLLLRNFSFNKDSLWSSRDGIILNPWEKS